MGTIAEFREKTKELMSNKEWGVDIKKCWPVLEEFTQKFPYRENPELIDQLKPVDVYDPGGQGYFFYYIEHKLRPLGSIYVPSDRGWRSAEDNIEKFRDLLRIAVDEQKSLVEKVDAKWEELKGWGKDKHFAKKIIFCYFPEDILPLFSTEHAERFVTAILGKDEFQSQASKYGKPYDDLSVGQKYAILQGILLGTKQEYFSDLKDLDNALFVRALYEMYPQSEPLTAIKVTEPLSAVRMLFSPTNEMGVVALFCMYHRELNFPYILKIQSYFPDATVIDSDGNVKNIEFKLRSSNFKSSGYDPSECDYIVCWEDDLPESDVLKSKVLCLKDQLGSEEEEE